MGRHQVNLKIHADKLRELLKGRETFSERAQKYGVSRQAVNEWLTKGRMPPRAIVELMRDLEISNEDMDELLSFPQNDESTTLKWVCTITLEKK